MDCLRSFFKGGGLLYKAFSFILSVLLVLTFLPVVSDSAYAQTSDGYSVDAAQSSGTDPTDPESDSTLSATDSEGGEDQDAGQSDDSDSSDGAAASADVDATSSEETTTEKASGADSDTSEATSQIEGLGSIALLLNELATLTAADSGCDHQYNSDGFCDECGACNPSASSYTVRTAANLAAIADAVNAGDKLENKTVTLAASIDLSAYADWTPIGDANTAFAGTFDGAGYAVENLTITDCTGGYHGLFGNNSGTVSNVSVSGTIGTSDAKITTGSDYIGGVVGYNSGTVTGVTGNVSIYVNTSSIYAVGGIVGQNTPDATVSQCSNSADIEGTKAVGGIVGRSYGTIAECFNTGDITGNGGGKDGIGGIVGRLGNSSGTYETLTYACYNTGTISNDNGRWHGGIAGFADEAATVYDCYDIGEIATGYSWNWNPIIGHVDSAYSTVYNNYSLEGLAVGNTGTSGSSEDTEEIMPVTIGTITSEEDFKSSDMIDKLNGNGTYYVMDTEGINDGYPVLAWQVEDSASVASPTVTAGSTGDGTVLLSIDGSAASESIEAAVGDTIVITATPADGSYLAQVRWAVLDEDADEDDPLAYTVLTADADGNYSFTMPSSGSVQVMADFISIVWDGTIDLTWYDTTSTTFYIQYAAQWAGLSLIVNGLFTTYPTSQDDSGNEIPDYEAFKAGMGVVEEVIGEGDDAITSFISSEYYGEFTATYRLNDMQTDGGATTRTSDITKTTCVVGDPNYVQTNSSSGASGSNNQTTTDDSYYGLDDFDGKTVYIVADLDFGATQDEDGHWDVTSPLFMSLGGQYAMLPGLETTNGYSKIGASWNGTLDGQGYSFSNVYMERYANSNYGDSVSVGLVGRMGIRDSDSSDLLAVDPTVRNIVLESGWISGRRSVGGIVGKIGQTTASVLNDGSTGGIIEYCINKADVHGTDAKGLGGIVGAGWNSGVVRFCANLGDVTSTYSSGLAGGISGSNEIPLYNCYSVGQISSGADRYAMGIGTKNGGTVDVSYCYWRTGSAPGGGYYGTYSGTGAIEFGEGCEYTELTAALLNQGAASVWLDDDTGINSYDGVSYPILAFQSEGYDANRQYTVTVVQPDDGGTISASPLVSSAGTTITLSNEPDVGMVLDYYTLNGSSLSTNTFTLMGNSTVSAVFRERASTTISIQDDTDEPYTITVTKTGEAIVGGVLQKVTDYPVSDGDTVYEGDVLTYTVTVREGATPDDESLEYSGVFAVSTYIYDSEGGISTTVSSNPYTVTGAESYGIRVEVSYVGTQSSSSWENFADTDWYDNSEDSQEDSYTISTAAELAGVAALVADGETFVGVTITLDADIDLSNTDSTDEGLIWTPIGTQECAFMGTFDGAGHTISGLTFDDLEYQGLFGCTDGATVKNLAVEGDVTVRSYGAAVIAYASATTVENVTNKATVTGNSSSQYVGGIIGRVNDSGAEKATSLIDVHNEGAVTAGTYVGGIVGYLGGSSNVQPSIENAENTGAVSATSTTAVAYAGGIAGALNGGVLSQVRNEGTVSGPSTSSVPGGYVGGLVGNVLNTGDNSIDESVNAGAVSGGVAGAGGIVGHSNAVLSISNVYNTAAIASTNSYTGGLLGYMQNTNTASSKTVLSNAYSIGEVSGTSGNSAGAVAGYCSGVVTFENVYYLEEAASRAVGYSSGLTSSSVIEATSQTADELRALASTLGDEYWRTDEVEANDGYPMLAWELPYILTYYDTSGEIAKTVALPEGYSASSSQVSSLYGDDPTATADEGYIASFQGWVTEEGGSTLLVLTNVSSDVDAWPYFVISAVDDSLISDGSSNLDATSGDDNDDGSSSASSDSVTSVSASSGATSATSTTPATAATTSTSLAQTGDDSALILTILQALIVAAGASALIAGRKMQRKSKTLR